MWPIRSYFLFTKTILSLSFRLPFVPIISVHSLMNECIKSFFGSVHKRVVVKHQNIWFTVSLCKTLARQVALLLATGNEKFHNCRRSFYSLRGNATLGWLNALRFCVSSSIKLYKHEQCQVMPSTIIMLLIIHYIHSHRAKGIQLNHLSFFLFRFVSC